MLAYGAVALLAGRMATIPKDRAIEVEGLVKWLLLASTTAMGVASSYFMYILNVKLGGASCTYCVGSAILSTTLLLCTLVVSSLIHSCCCCCAISVVIACLEIVVIRAGFLP